MPIQPVPIGQQGTATYRPNWGQPIVNGQWQGQPQTTPAIDPRKIVSDRLGSLRADFKQRANTLKASGLDAGIHNRILAGWQDEYDQAKAELTGATSQLDLIQQQVGAGGMTQEAGREAAIRMIVPRETADLMFPSVRAVTPGVTGVSPAGMASQVGRFDTIREGMLEYPEGKEWWRWDTKKASKKKMIKRYFNERHIANLNDPRNVNKIPGFNQAFIESMGGDERTADLLVELLDPETGDPRMRAAFAPDSAVNRGFMSQFKDTKPHLGVGVSPLGKSIAKGAPKKFKGASAGMTYPFTPQTEQRPETNDQLGIR